MTIDTSPEALAKMRAVAKGTSHPAMWEEAPLVLALIDALEEARAALREAAPVIALLSPNAAVLARIDAVLNGKPIPAAAPPVGADAP